MPIDLGTGRQPFDRVYQVQHPFSDPSTPGEYANTPSNVWKRVAYSGGELKLTDQTGGALFGSNSVSTNRTEIRRGDWICLTNVMFDPDKPQAEKRRFVQQMEFYQVLDATVDATVPPGWLVTLQGPNFDFGWSYTDASPDNQQVYGTGFGSGFGDYSAQVFGTGPIRYIPSKTYAIHLPDVWSVVERTFRRPAN
jgi:hypothetical protein